MGDSGASALGPTGIPPLAVNSTGQPASRRAGIPQATGWPSPPPGPICCEDSLLLLDWRSHCPGVLDPGRRARPWRSSLPFMSLPDFFFLLLAIYNLLYLAGIFLFPGKLP